MEYIKGKGIFVGIFDEEDIAKGKDKISVEILAEQTGYKYTNTEFIRMNNGSLGVKIYVCDVDDFKL